MITSVCVARCFLTVLAIYYNNITDVMITNKETELYIFTYNVARRTK